MEQQTTIENQKGTWKKYRFLAGSVLGLCMICILISVALTSKKLIERQKTISNTTATAVAHTVEQDQYEVVERFDVPTNLWYSGPEDDEYWVGQVSIENGAYIWNADEVKQTFYQWADFHGQNSASVSNFDVYMDVKFKGTLGGVCGGLVFRDSRNYWQDARYVFSICNNSYFEVYYDDQDGWHAISDWKHNNSIQPDDWNRIEISARGDHFTFTINNEMVYEMTDDRQKRGGLAILFNAQDTKPATVWFDNFGYQSR
jgi:hypothetical protein